MGKGEDFVEAREEADGMKKEALKGICDGNMEGIER